MLIVTAHNVRQYCGYADYDVVVRVNEKLIAKLHVKGHERELGWQELLHRIATAGATAPTAPGDTSSKGLDKQEWSGCCC